MNLKANIQLARYKLEKRVCEMFLRIFRNKPKFLVRRNIALAVIIISLCGPISIGTTSCTCYKPSASEEDMVYTVKSYYRTITLEESKDIISYEYLDGKLIFELSQAYIDSHTYPRFAIFIDDPFELVMAEQFPNERISDEGKVEIEFELEPGVEYAVNIGEDILIILPVNE